MESPILGSSPCGHRTTISPMSFAYARCRDSLLPEAVPAPVSVVATFNKMRMRSVFLLIGAILILIMIPFTGSSANTLPATPTVQPRVSNALGKGQNRIYLVSVLSGAMPVALKKGISLTYGDCDSAIAVRAIWEQGWSPTPANCAGVENVPMIWGAGDVNTTVGGNSQYIMGFNEPDSSSQSNLTASQAATLWRQIEQKYPARKLVAPAPSGANPDWIVDFRNAYISLYAIPPRLDALDVHCYAWYAEQCITHTQKFISWADSWGISEVWVSEFSFSPTSPSSPTGSIAEAQTFINWAMGTSKVTRYAWFASRMSGTEWWFNPQFNTPAVQWNTTSQLTSYGTMYLPFK